MDGADSNSGEGETATFGDWLDRHPYVVASTLVAVILVIYGKVVGFGILPSWDDPLYFVERKTVTDWFDVAWIRRLTTPTLGYPVPVPTALYAMVRELPFSTAVAVAHGLNVAFHATNAVLVYALARRWLAIPGTAAVVGLVWAVHPVHAESVCWITSLKFVSFGTFFIGAVLTWSYHLDETTRAKAWVTVVLGVLALGCRPEAVMLPIVLGAMTWLETRRLPNDRLLYIPLVGLAIVAAAYVPVAVSGQHEQIYMEFEQNVYSIGAILVRLGATFKVQLVHLFWPFDLHPVYYYPSNAAHVVDAWIGFGMFVVAAGGTVRLYQIKHRAVWPLAFFWVTYLPISGLEYLPRGTADAYAYLYSFGLIAAMVALCASGLARVRVEIRRLAVFAFVGVVLALGVTTSVQADRWRDPLSLWEPLRQEAPYAAEPHRIVGETYFNLERYEKALEVFREGYESMRREDRVSLAMLMTLERLGRPQRAFDLGLESLNSTKRLDEDYESYLLTLMAEHDLPWPEKAGKRAAIKRIAEVVLEKDRLNAAESKTVAVYLDRIGKKELAAQFRADFRAPNRLQGNPSNSRQ